MSNDPPPTIRLFHEDASLLGFDARVLAQEPRSGAHAAVLDRTAFYPDSGGQPADRGRLGGRAVLGVVEEADVIVHLLDGPLDGATVHGEVDAARRADHMQQHTGQHILSQAFIATSGRETLSFHLGETRSSIEVAGPASADEIRAAEALANRVVFEDREVRVLSLSAEDAVARGIRKRPEREGPLRIIDIDGFDVNACGGTHVRRTGQVGLIKTLGTERIRGNTRVEFVCGGRALADYGARFETLRALAESFTTSESELGAVVERLRVEARESRKALEEVRRDLAAHRARALEAAFAPFGRWRLLSRVIEPQDGAAIGDLARMLTEAPGRVVLLADGATGRLLFARSKEDAPPGDLAEILRRAVAEAGGKGGGRPEQAQGSVPRAEDTGSVLDTAERLLRDAPA